MGSLKALVDRVVAFLEPVAGTIYGHLNKEEFERAILAGVLSGGGAWGVASALWSALPDLFTDPSDAVLVKLIVAFVSAALALYAEVLRRLGHGSPPAPALRLVGRGFLGD